MELCELARGIGWQDQISEIFGLEIEFHGSGSWHWSFSSADILLPVRDEMRRRLGLPYLLREGFVE